MPLDESEVTIRLTQSEAVVLDAFLRRFSETDRLTIEDQSEQQAFWNLQCIFERLENREWPSLEYSRAVLRGDVE